MKHNWKAPPHSLWALENLNICMYECCIVMLAHGVINVKQYFDKAQKSIKHKNVSVCYLQ